MNKERKLIIAGNWKMNKTVAEALTLVQDLKIELANITAVDIVVCPPFTALSEVAKAIRGSNIHLGAQNMSEHGPGAYTGAQRTRRPLCHSRSLGATPVSQGIRRVNFKKSASGACCITRTHCVCR